MQCSVSGVARPKVPAAMTGSLMVPTTSQPYGPKRDPGRAQSQQDGTRIADPFWTTRHWAWLFASHTPSIPLTVARHEGKISPDSFFTQFGLSLWLPGAPDEGSFSKIVATTTAAPFSLDNSGLHCSV